jgi:circadian clock protein KaiB
MHQFRLYVVGHSPRTAEAVRLLGEILTDRFDEAYDLQIVDLLKEPAAGEEDNIFATPTLVKRAPPPSAKVIGDFRDKNRVLAGLGVH